MRNSILTIALVLLAASAGNAQEARVYKWVDENGLTHYGDSIPARFAELPKEVLNEHGVTVRNLEGKKSPEQIEAERIANEQLMVKELRKRADQALLATYLTVDEILMHRDRRVELFQARSRVTELYLTNLERRLVSLRNEAALFRPYSDNSDAPMIGEELAEELQRTKTKIANHERNLKKFKADEQQIVARFAGDISRFKLLKGIN